LHIRYSSNSPTSTIYNNIFVDLDVTTDKDAVCRYKIKNKRTNIGGTITREETTHHTGRAKAGQGYNKLTILCKRKGIWYKNAVSFIIGKLEEEKKPIKGRLKYKSEKIESGWSKYNNIRPIEA